MAVKTVIVSGYFDPLHVGHLEMLQLARRLGDELVVIVNNDVQAKMKKGRAFMREEDRLEIVKSIRYVDLAFLSTDENLTVCNALRKIKKTHLAHDLVFANGGDRKDYEVPESKTCKELNIEMVDGLGEKIRSSSNYTGLK